MRAILVAKVAAWLMMTTLSFTAGMWAAEQVMHLIKHLEIIDTRLCLLELKEPRELHKDLPFHEYMCGTYRKDQP